MDRQKLICRLFLISRFARENTKGKPIGKISKYEEIARLATSIDTMETDMVNYMEHLTTLTADKQRISTELSLATQIQATMMPHIYPAFPDRTEFDIYALMHHMQMDVNRLCLEKAPETLSTPV